MGLETKVLSREIQQILYDNGMTLGTAESCTGGRIAEAIIAVPGASNYFKGAIVSYATEIKEKLLHVDHELIEEKGVVSEEVAKAMVAGACDALDVDFAISSTGVAGPSGGTAATPVGTIWLAYGCKDDIRTLKLSEDNGRDINLTNATNTAIRLFLAYVKEKAAEKE